MRFLQFTVLVISLGLLTTTAAAAKEVLARVDGRPITDHEIKGFLVSRGVAHPSNAQIRQGLSAYVQRLLLVQQAVKENLQNNGALRFRQQQHWLDLLSQAALQSYLQKHPVKESRIKKAYQDFVKKYPDEEYRLRVIVVKKQATAEHIIAKLKAGISFSNLASDNSLPDYNPAGGGEIGWRRLPNLDPRIDKVVTGLKEGQVGGPVWTTKGWWIIQLMQQRRASPPTLKAVRTKIVNELRNADARAYLASLQKAAHVTIDSPLKNALPATHATSTNKTGKTASKLKPAPKPKQQR